MSTYTTVQGDMWDSIAHKLTGSEEVTAQLIEANLDKSAIYIFPAGVVLNVPDFNNYAADEEYYPPWKK
jgi:phage tail protein X